MLPKYLGKSWTSPSYTYESPRDKTNEVSVRPAKTQISMGICPVWSESSLCAQWVAKGPSFLHADSKDSDQTGRMPRLIWVFAGHTLTLMVLSRSGSYLIVVICKGKRLKTKFLGPLVKFRYAVWLSLFCFTFSWKKDGSNIPFRPGQSVDSNGTLHITKVENADVGNYTCVVESSGQLLSSVEATLELACE